MVGRGFGIWVVFLTLVVLGVSGSSQAKALVPVEAFGGKDHISRIIISPDGTRISKLRWGNDDRVILSIRYESTRFDVPMVETRMMSFSRDLKKSKVIPKYNRVRTKGGTPVKGIAQFHDTVIHLMPDDPEHVLFAFDREGYGRELNLYKLDIYTGATRKVSDGNRNISSYTADPFGNPCLRTRYQPGEKEFIREKYDLTSRTWAPFMSAAEASQYAVIACTRDPNALLVSARGTTGTDGIYEFDLTTKQPRRTLFSNAQFDYYQTATDPHSWEVIGTTYIDDHLNTEFFDPAMASLSQKIQALLPGRRFRILNWDRNKERFIVKTSTDTDPGHYYLYLKTANQVFEIGKAKPDLADVPLRPVVPIKYTSRDGQEIPAYLTTPSGSGPFPTVVMPHGGPTSRDWIRFNYQVQFLANRGYAVLQPNFRGSSGYGLAFEEAGGKGQWGLRMQDDVTDGTKHLIDQGIADPDRICIVGWSYGGYAALMGAVKTPDLFKCAVAGAAVTDIPEHLKARDRFKFTDHDVSNVGSYRDDKGLLRDNSPLNNVDAIKIPILLLHGDNDRRVDIKQSKRMASKLKKAKKPHKFVTLKKAGHHLEIGEHSIRFLKELEAFLAEHLK